MTEIDPPFEYRVVRVTPQQLVTDGMKRLEDRLNELGDDDWEMVSAVGDQASGSTQGFFLFFKRKRTAS